MAKAEEERTLAFDRARTTNPARARRADRDALSDADRVVLDDEVPTGRKGNGHNRATDGDRVLTGRAVNENTVVTNRAGAPDPVIEEARNGTDWRDSPSTDAGTSGHRPLRRRLHRHDR